MAEGTEGRRLLNRDAVWAASVVGAIALAILHEGTDLANWASWLIAIAIGVAVVVVAVWLNPARSRS